MNNIEALRSLIKGELIEEEGDEFLDAIEEELEYYESEIKSLKGEISGLEDKIEDLEEQVDKLEDPVDSDNYEEHVISGLDTIYIKLEHGNLEIQSRIDTFIERLKKHYNATQV